MTLGNVELLHHHEMAANQGTAQVENGAFSAGSNEEKKEMPLEKFLHHHHETAGNTGTVIVEKGDSPVNSEETKPDVHVSEESVTVHLSKGTWINLWAVVVVTILFNLGICIWCQRRMNQPVHDQYDGDQCGSAVRYEDDV